MALITADTKVRKSGATQNRRGKFGVGTQAANEYVKPLTAEEKARPVKVHLPVIKPYGVDEEELYESLTVRSGGCFGDEYHVTPAAKKVAPVLPQQLQVKPEISDILFDAAMSRADIHPDKVNALMKDIEYALKHWDECKTGGSVSLDDGCYLWRGQANIHLDHSLVHIGVMIAPISNGVMETMKTRGEVREFLIRLEKAKKGNGKEARSNKGLIETGKRLTASAAVADKYNVPVRAAVLAAAPKSAAQTIALSTKSEPVNMRGKADWNVRVFPNKGEVICL